MLQRLKLALTCILLAALTGLVIQAALLVHTATVATRALPGALSVELAATRTALADQTEAARKDLVGQVAAARQDLFIRTERQVAALRDASQVEVRHAVEAASGTIQDAVRRSDTKVDVAVAEIHGLRTDLQPGIQNVVNISADLSAISADVKQREPGMFTDLASAGANATSITRQVNDALPLWLDCEGNPSCAFNLYQGTAKSFENMAQNVDRLTKPKWYDRLIGYGLNGVVMYRNLNPVTSLAITGAQVVSSRP
jgi:hypothetical protein